MKFSLAMKSAPSQAPRTGEGAAGRSLWVYHMPVLLVTVVVILLLGVATVQVLDDAKGEVNENSARTAMQALSDGLSGALASRQNQLTMLVALGDLRDALQSGDAQRMRQAAGDAGLVLPDVLQLRLFANEEVAPDPDGAAPMGYAGVDMLRRALSGSVPRAEVHQINVGSPYLAMALPVKRDDAVVGALFAAWPLKTVTRLVANAPVFPGDFQLVQGGSGGYVVAGSGPGESLSAITGSIEVPGSIWKLIYSTRPADSQKELTLIAALGLGGLLALVLAVFLAVRVFKRDIREDMASLVNLGEAIFNSQGAVERKPRVSSSRDAILLLTELARRGKQPQSAARNRETAGAAPVAGDNIVVEEVSPAQPGAVAMAPVPAQVPQAIFRAYDVRGVVGDDLNADIARLLALAFAEKAVAEGISQVCLARDARLSSPQLYQAFSEGLVGGGMQVLELGQVPVALPYFAMHTTPHSAAVMVTGSHNPPQYNGFKLYLDAQPLAGEQLAALRERMLQGGFSMQQGKREERDLRATYLEAVCKEVQPVRNLRVVVDGGNGVAGELACELLGALGCEAIPLFCEPDGEFPNHHPDPSQRDNLASLALEVEAQQADLGIAFDGDGDRLGVVDNTGNYVWPEHLLMLLSADVLQRHPGTDVIYDVKSSRHLAGFVLAHGGRPIMWKSGHTRMKEKMHDSGALLGGEFSGHFFIKERWYGSDDAIYAAARLLEIIAADPRPFDQVIADLPSSSATPEYQLLLEEGEAQVLMRQLEAAADFGDARLVTLDGMRVEFTHGWGLVRPSNTTPSLTFRFEADNEMMLGQIQDEFRELLNKVMPERQLPF